MIERSPLIFLLVCAALDIVANLLMKKSDGFKNRVAGVSALFLVCAAFAILSRITRVMDLAVAYAIWGAFAVLGSAIAAHFAFHQKIGKRGWAGIVLIACAVVLLES